MLNTLFFRVLILLLLATAGCLQQSGYQQSPFSANGTRKPVIGIAPYALSDELSSQLTLRFLEKDQHYLSFLKAEEIEKKGDPFGGEISWFKELFPDEEFLIFVRWIEPLLSTEEEPTKLLKSSVLLRVIDLRGKEPKLLVHEIICAEQYLPHQFANGSRKNEFYAITPQGLADGKLVNEIFFRIESAIRKNG